MICGQIYNDRRLLFGAGANVLPNDSFGSVPSSPNADRRVNRSKGKCPHNAFKL